MSKCIRCGDEAVFNVEVSGREWTLCKGCTDRAQELYDAVLLA